MRCLYDGAVAYADHEVGRLLAAVDELGLAERTLIVVTADHGEAFFEHDQPLHATLHEEVARIPLIVRAPGGAAGKQAGGLVALIDLLPTVLELTGVPAAGPIQGRSFARVVMDWPATVSGSVLATTPSAAAVSLRQDSFSYIERTPRAQSFGLAAAVLYEHSSDRGEAANLADVDAARVEALGRELAARRAASRRLYEQIAGDERPSRVHLSAPQREQLRALGYATGADGK
jgi:arylsulfatase A-like enzyme